MPNFDLTFGLFSRFSSKDPIELKPDTKSTEQDDENNIDLDTRIAMMFKEKSFGAAPPFLQLDDSESETEKEDRPMDTNDDSIMEKIKTEMNAEHSVENSMHGTSEVASNDSTSMGVASNSGDMVKVKTEKKIIEDGASDISSDDEVLESCTPPKPMAGDIKLEDDKMSLSSLSSTEDKSRKPMISDPSLCKNVVPPGSDYYYPSDTNAYYQYPNGENAVYDPYNSQCMPSHGYMQPYIAGFPALIPGGYVQSTEYPTKRDEPVAPVPEPKRDPSEQILAAVIERVKTELKQILIKDFNKRMIENIAYKKFDTWWDEQVQNKNKPTITPV